MAREFASGVRFAQVSALPAAASNVGVVLEQGGKLWFSNGTTWEDLGAAGGGGSSTWTRITGNTTAVAGTNYLAVVTTATDLTLPAFTAGQTFAVANSRDSTATVRVVIGGGNVINAAGFATGDNITCQPGETISLVAESTTELDLVTPGAVGPAGPAGGGSTISEKLRALLENATHAFNNNPRTRAFTAEPPTITVGTATPPAAHTRVYTFGAAGAPFVSSGGRATTAAGRTTFPVVTPSATRIDFVWRVETVVDSDSVGFLLDSAAANGYRFIVDGQYVSATGSSSAAGSERYYRLQWATKARRTVIVEGNRNLGFWGAAVPDDAQCILPNDPDALRMFFVGDSNPFLEGFNQKGDSYGLALGDFLGIRDTWVAAISSTGFVVAGGGNNYGGRRDDWESLPEDSIDLLIFQLSYNDYNASIADATLKAAIAAELAAARTAHPNAVIIVHGNNSWNDSAPSIAGLSQDEVLAQEAVTEADDPLMAFLPIYTATGQTLPITGQSASGDTGTGNTPRYVNHAADHMSPAGNIYFAQWLARRLVPIFAQMAGVPVPSFTPAVVESVPTAPGGADRALQFNDNGTLGGAANVAIGPGGNLRLVGLSTQPAAPAAGTIQLYSRIRAGQAALEIQRDNGREIPMQEDIALNRVGYWAPSSGTTVNTMGLPRTVVGTVSTPGIAVTNFSTSVRRWRVQSAATANAVSDERAGQNMVGRGNANYPGGFRLVTRVSLATLQASSVGFFGLWSTTGAGSTTQAIAALTNFLGFGFTNGVNTNWQCVRNDAAGAPTLIDLGASFPVSSLTNVYTITVAAGLRGDSFVHFRMVEEVSGAVFEDAYDTDLPSVTTLLNPRQYLNNGGVAAAVAYECSGLYLSSDF